MHGTSGKSGFTRKFDFLGEFQKFAGKSGIPPSQILQYMSATSKHVFWGHTTPSIPLILHLSSRTRRRCASPTAGLAEHFSTPMNSTMCWDEVLPTTPHFRDALYTKKSASKRQRDAHIDAVRVSSPGAGGMRGQGAKG